MMEPLRKIFEGSPHSIVGRYDDNSYVVCFGRGDDIVPIAYILSQKKTANLTLFAGHGWRMQKLFDYLKENDFSVREYAPSHS